jgi:predicted phosphodiesterase
VDGIRLLNPGSVWKNRDETPACLMELEVTDTAIQAVRVNLIELKFRK